MLAKDTENRIVNALKPLEPDMVILFGSYAWGEPRRDSDLDLYVVTKDEGLPASFRERNKLYQRYAHALESLYEDISVDLIVHTKSMHRKFIELDSLFCKKIMKSGVPLL